MAGPGFRAAIPLIDVIKMLGLTSGLKLCLDAGDRDSYTSGQSWLDRSGNGYDFFLGTTSGVEITDPVFTGTVGGLSPNEYWAFDADASFTYDSPNETWMNNIHKAGAKYTFLAWVYITAVGAGATSACMAGTLGNASGATQEGFQWVLQTGTGLNRMQVFKTPSTAVLTATSSGTAASINAWHLVGISIDEAGGATAGQFYLDGATNGAAFNPAYAAPSAAAAAFKLQVGAEGANLRSLGVNGAARMAGIAMWEGTVLTAAQIAAIYNATDTPQYRRLRQHLRR